MSNEDGYCERHDLYYPEHYGCPWCEEEARVEAERMHMMTRDPTVEPY